MCEQAETRPIVSITQADEQDIVRLRRLFDVPGPCRRVLLIKPLCVDEADFDLTVARHQRYYNYPPYGLGLLCAQLKQRGYHVTLCDLNQDILDRALQESSTFHGPEDIRRHWQVSLRRLLKRFQPHVVGISCTFTMTHTMLQQVAAFVKSHDRRIPVVAGGVHVTAALEEVLAPDTKVDFVALFDGDLSFGDLLEVVNGRLPVEAVRQLAWRDINRVVRVETMNVPEGADIDVAPDYDLLPIGRYRALGEMGVFRFWLPPEVRGGIVISNRGCRGRCAFCTVWKFNGKRVRARSVTAVVDEIEGLYRRYGIRHITWLDDDLFYDAQRTLALFAELESRRLPVTWDASNGVITSALARCPELMQVAVASGCIGMYFGIESGSPKILRDMRKPSRVEHHLEAGRILQDFPQVFTRGFLMMGYPGETLGQMFETVDLARRMDLDWYTVSLLTPLPSTDLYDRMVEEQVNEDAPEGGGIRELMQFVGYAYAVRHGESRRALEQKARGFQASCAPDAVPTRTQLNDLWLLIDYKVNYEKILEEARPGKLTKMQRFLTDVTERMAREHPLAHLFLGIVLHKLNQGQAAQKHLTRSQQYLEASPYWQQFFDALDLMSLYETTFTPVSGPEAIPAGKQAVRVVTV